MFQGQVRSAAPPRPTCPLGLHPCWRREQDQEAVPRVQKLAVRQLLPRVDEALSLVGLRRYLACAIGKAAAQVTHLQPVRH